MCCYYSKEATKALRARMKAKGGVMTLWKVYTPQPLASALKSPCQPACLVEAAGSVQSTREVRAPGKDFRDVSASGMSTEINRGIHVFFNKAVAAKWALRGDVIVPVRCRLRDLVCAGSSDTGDAVFMKIEILPTNFNRAIQNG